MRMSKCCPNFYLIYRQTPFEFRLPYRAYRLPNHNLEGHVCTDSPAHSHSDSSADYATRLRIISLPLRLLTENEIFRLMVWANPTNDPKRGSDHTGTTAVTLFEAR